MTEPNQITPTASTAAALAGTYKVSIADLTTPIPANESKKPKSILSTFGNVSQNYERTENNNGKETLWRKTRIEGGASYKLSNGNVIKIFGASTLVENLTTNKSFVELAVGAVATIDKLKISGGGKINLSTSAIEWNANAAYSTVILKLDKSTLSSISEINWDKNTVELRTGLRLKIGDPALTAYLTYNLDPDVKDKIGAQADFSTSLGGGFNVTASVDTNNNGIGPRGYLSFGYKF